MKKMIVFVVVFFVVDRFMNYKLDHSSKKSRVMAISSDSMSQYILLSEKKERTSDAHPKVLIADNKKKSFLNRLNWPFFFYSSNRNV